MQLCWTPSSSRHVTLNEFTAKLNKRHSLALSSYNDVYAFSITRTADFWLAVLEFTAIKFSGSWSVVVEDKPMDQFPKWFPGVTLNFAENILMHAAANPQHTAMIAVGEYLSAPKIFTYQELYASVQKAAGALRALGIVKGDRVGAYIPNCPEAIIMMLAVASLGAVWSSTSPDFGLTGVLERFAQIRPKILLTVNAVVYNGKTYDHLDKVKGVLRDLNVETCIVIPFVDRGAEDLGIANGLWWQSFLNLDDGQPLQFAQLPFDHPLYILYSSGTTGKPKCIVHSAGGTLLQHKKEHVIHGNLTAQDVVFQYTTTGWMMWNWLASCLSFGATIVLYEGSPFKPKSSIMFDLIDSLGVTVFGTSAKFLASTEEMGIVPNEIAKFDKLHSIYSTGSPLKPESYDFVYKHFKSDVLLGSITGGTDIISLFAGHCSALPVYRGEIQCRCLGMAIAAWDDNNKEVFDQSGDLVCTKPFPSMPVYFWDDVDNKKYRSAYFDRVAGIWYHGDYVMIDSKTGGVVMLGRSDGTLKPAGVRFGSAELYNVLEGIKGRGIADSLVVGQKVGDDERVIMFIKMEDGRHLDTDLVKTIKTKIRNELSPRHVPAIVMPIADIPYTINGKKVEVAVKKIISGEAMAPSGQLANPDSLKLFQNLPELQLN